MVKDEPAKLTAEGCGLNVERYDRDGQRRPWGAEQRELMERMDGVALVCSKAKSMARRAEMLSQLHQQVMDGCARLGPLIK